MALVVNTNVASIQAQYNVNKTNQEMSQAMERLSSGMRINSAADDAAGLAISSRMEAQVRGLSQSIRNANDAISLTQTAEGAMDEMDAILQRMNELAIQAANGAMNPSDRQAIQDEVDVLISEIDRIADQTRFNNIKVLDGSFADQFMVGQAAGEKVALEIGDMRSTAFGVGAFADNGMSISTARGNVEGNDSVAQIDKLTLSGTPTSGDVYEIDVDGSKLTYTVTGSEGGLGGVRDAIAQRINNDASIKRVVSASAGTGAGDILLTAKAAGEAFSASAVGKDVASLNSVAVSVATVQQNVASVTAQAQVDRVTIAGAVEVGDTYTLTADGQTVSYTVGTSDSTIADIVTGIQGQISNNAYMSAKFTVASATNGGGTVDGFTITANNAGESFQASFASTNRVAAASTVTQTNSTANAVASQESQVIDFSNVGPIEQDDKFSVTIGTQSVSYTANTGDSIQDVRDALSTAITGLGVSNLTASNVGTDQIKIQAASGAEFTITALSTNNAGSTNDNTISVNAATQAAQAATVGLSEFVLSNANLTAGEELSFTVDINGTEVTTATKYSVVANDLVDQTAFRNRLVTFLNADANMQGAATTPVFSAGKDAQSIDITAGGTGTSAHVGAGSIKSDTTGKHTFTVADPSSLDAGDTVQPVVTLASGALTASAAYTLTAADVGDATGATLATNLAAYLSSDATFANKVSFSASGATITMETLDGGASNDIDESVDVSFGFTDNSGDADTYADASISQVTAAADAAATSGASFAVRTAPLDSQSQVQSVTITGTIEKGDKYVINHGATKFEYTVLGTEGPTLEHLRNAIVTAMNAGGSALSGVATAANGAGAGDIILTSAGNSAVTITGTATDRGSSANANAAITVTSKVDAEAQVEKFALAGNVEEGDVYTVTVDGTSFAYTATAADVAGGMRALTDSIIAGVNSAASGLNGTVLAERSAVATEFTLKSQAPGTAIVASLAITNRSAAVQTTNLSTTTANRVAVSAVAQKDAVSIASPGANGFTAGLTFTLSSTVDGGGATYSYTHTTTANETAASVVTNLISNFNSVAGVQMTASVDPNDSLKIFVSANVAGTDITTSLGDGTDTATPLSADVTSVQANQGGVAAVAQQEVVELAGTVEGQDTYSLTINGETVSFTTTGMEKTLDSVASTLADLINANGNIASKVLAESAGNGQIRLTSKVAGEAFTVEGSAENGQGGSLNAVSVLDQDQAESALNVISAAIERVNYQRSALGAMENRLDHTISNLGNIVTNTEASQSRIADADFAAESAKLAKNQILLQAGTAMLAQANASQQTVLSLLG